MKFIGSYIDQMKLALLASSLSGVNLIMVSKPGCGKTRASFQAAKKICGENPVFIGLTPSSPPEKVTGMPDPIKALNGILEYILVGTPYDPAAKIVILDEIGRSSDIVNDELLQAIDRITLDDPYKVPVFWGTTNFIVKSERSQALQDRFGLWAYLVPDVDVEGIVTSHLDNGKLDDEEWKKSFPTWDECIKIRKTRINEKAKAAIVTACAMLAEEAIAHGFDVNPRRLSQWSDILRCVSIYFAGDDFEVIPPEAKTVLQWAYPNATTENAMKWKSICISLQDIVALKIEEYKQIAVENFTELVKTTDPHDKTALMQKLGEALATCQQEMKKIAPNDPRVITALGELNEMFARAIQGKPLIDK